MKRKVLMLLMAMAALCSHAKKAAKQSLWPDGSVVSEWFSDTAKVDVKTLGKQYVITKYGVKNAPDILQTQKIQAVIDRCAKEGGGVIVVPRGTFLTGALFFKKGTHLHFEDGGMLRGIDDIRHYPLIKMHMEGKMIDYFAALVTAEQVDGFSITGHGTIDGNGLRFWEEFWIRRKWNKKCTNLEALRPQLVYIAHCNDVTLQDVQLVNSPYWTTHLYHCERIKYLDCHIESPTFGDYHAPSSDAIDLDICNDVLVRGCYMNICDDAVCLKGGRGTYVDRDPSAGSVNRVIVDRCRFGNNVNAGVTFGSEAWDCHNVIMRNCRFENSMRMLLFKMRPDTPQQYGDVLVENCSGKVRYSTVEASTWMQFYNQEKRPDMPESCVRNVTVRNIQMRSGRFFHIDMKQPFYLSDFTLEDIQAVDNKNCFEIQKIQNVKVRNVTLNGKTMTNK